MLRSSCSMLKPIVTDTVPRRFRRFKILTWPIDYLPFKWTYPAKLNLLENSGDHIRGIPEVNLNRPVGAFGRLPELEKAPEAIQRVFSVGLAPRNEIKKLCEEELVNLVRRYPTDKESLEYIIGHKTFRIRLLREQFSGTNRRNKRMKDFFNRTVQKRNKYLSQLGRLDQVRYQYVKDALEIEHTPFPLGEGHKKVTRKGELRRLTDEYAKKVKEDKMEAYHQELKAQQEAFKLEKQQTEEWIANEIKELKLSDDELNQLEFKGIFQ